LEGLGFIRVHRSHLINRRFLKVMNDNGSAIMADDRQINISRRRRKTVISKLTVSDLPAGKHSTKDELQL
jgi:DNA-binding LytR/AlgR family response regulator